MVDLDQSSSAHVFSRVTYHTPSDKVGYILRKLYTYEHTRVRTHRNKEMANHLLIIDI